MTGNYFRYPLRYPLRYRDRDPQPLDWKLLACATGLMSAHCAAPCGALRRGSTGVLVAGKEARAMAGTVPL